jgi:hypothetical protein
MDMTSRAIAVHGGSAGVRRRAEGNKGWRFGDLKMDKHRAKMAAKQFWRVPPIH